MEKILKTNNQTPTNINQNLILNNRNHLKIDAIKEIIRSNDSELLLKMNNNEKITILGNNINITKLDVESGVIEANGLFNSIQYNSKPNLFKRIFK